MKSNKSNKSSIFSFVTLTGFSLFEKIVAFAYQAVLAAILGASLVTDSYNSASQLFDLVDTTVLGAIVISVIYRFTDISKNKNEAAAFDFLSNISSGLTLLMGTIAVAIFTFAKPVSYLIAPGFEEAGRPSLVLCIRILCLLPPIMVTASVRQALLRQKKCFIAVNSRSLCISLVGMAALIFFSRRYPDKVSILCIGYIISNLIFAMVLVICGNRFGKIRFVIPKIDSDMKALLLLAVPTIISTGIVRLSLMVDQIIASTVGTGAISYLGYAHSLYHLVSNLLIVNLCMILLTDITNLAINDREDEIIARISSSVSSILLLLLPVTILTVCFSKEIVEIAYQRGAFGAEATKQVAGLLLIYAVGFIPSLMNSVYTQVLYSFGKTKWAMYNTLISLGSNIILSLIFSRLIGLFGIAVGTTVSQTIAYFAYHVSVKKVLPEYRFAVNMKYIFKIAVAFAPCLIVIALVKAYISSALWSFVAATAGTFALFMVLLILLKEENVMRYFKVVHSMFAKK